MPEPVRLPSISYIVARGHYDHVIGCENRLPWRLPTDMKRFRDLTTGHAVIMGKKTFDSIGKPLQKRTNIVMSRSLRSNYESLSYAEDTQLCYANTEEDAIFLADIFSISRSRDDFFIIGGEEIYSIFNKLVNKVYLTEVFAHFGEGDAFFKNRFHSKTWKLTEETDFIKSDKDEFGFRFSTYERRERRYRYKFLSSFFTDIEAKDLWLRNKIRGEKQRFELHEIDHEAKMRMLKFDE